MEGSDKVETDTGGTSEQLPEPEEQATFRQNQGGLVTEHPSPQGVTMDHNPNQEGVDFNSKHEDDDTVNKLLESEDLIQSEEVQGSDQSTPELMTQDPNENLEEHGSDFSQHVKDIVNKLLESEVPVKSEEVQGADYPAPKLVTRDPNDNMEEQGSDSSPEDNDIDNKLPESEVPIPKDCLVSAHPTPAPELMTQDPNANVDEQGSDPSQHVKDIVHKLLESEVPVQIDEVQGADLPTPKLLTTDPNDNLEEQGSDYCPEDNDIDNKLPESEVPVPNEDEEVPNSHQNVANEDTAFIQQLLCKKFSFPKVPCAQWIDPYNLQICWPSHLPFRQLGCPPSQEEYSLMKSQLINETYWDYFNDPKEQASIRKTLNDPLRGTDNMTSYRNCHVPYPTYNEVCGFDGLTPSDCSSNFVSCMKTHFRATGLYAESLKIWSSESNLDDQAKQVRATFFTQDLWNLCPNLKAVTLGGEWKEKDLANLVLPPFTLDQIELVVVELQALDMIAATCIAGILRKTKSLEVPGEIFPKLSSFGSHYPRLSTVIVTGLSEDDMINSFPFFRSCPLLSNLVLRASVVETPSIFSVFLLCLIQQTGIRHLGLDESFKPRINVNDYIKLPPLASLTLEWRTMSEDNRDILKLFVLTPRIHIMIINHAQNLDTIRTYASGILDPSTNLTINYI